MFPESHLSESHEADLPAELQLLAAQLQGEANQLAESYPAEGRQASALPLSEPATARRRSWLWSLLGGSAAAGLLLPLMWFGLTEPSPSGSCETTRDTANVIESEVSRTGVPAPQIAAPETDSASEPMPVYPVGIGLPRGGNQSSQPTAGGLSAPEWEAVLDLTPAQEWEGVELSL